jgi:subfamily B ATP-binding cassette protein MsbA
MSATTSSWTLYRRMLRFVRPHWKVALLAFLAMLASAALEPVFPALMKPLIDDNLIAGSLEKIWEIPLLIVLVFGV